MISKEGIKKSINLRTENSYPGIKDYYLRYVSDELIDYAMKESLDGIFMFRNSEIISKYDLNRNEFMKVLCMMKEDKQNITYQELHEYTEVHLKKEKCDYFLTDEDHISQCRQNLDGSFDETDCGLKMFHKTYLKDLIYSSSQASKVLRDIIWKLQDKVLTPENELKCKDFVEEFIKNVNNAKINEEDAANDAKRISLCINDKSYIEKSYLNLCIALGIPEIELISVPVTESMLRDVMMQYNEALKYEQIKGNVDDYLQYYLGEHDDLDEDWISIDETAKNIEKDLKSYNPYYDQQEKLNQDDLSFVHTETIESIQQQYEINKEKEKEFMMK